MQKLVWEEQSGNVDAGVEIPVNTPADWYDYLTFHPKILVND